MVLRVVEPFIRTNGWLFNVKSVSNHPFIKTYDIYLTNYWFTQNVCNISSSRRTPIEKKGYVTATPF